MPCLILAARFLFLSQVLWGPSRGPTALHPPCRPACGVQGSCGAGANLLHRGSCRIAARNLIARHSCRARCFLREVSRVLAGWGSVAVGQQFRASLRTEG